LVANQAWDELILGPEGKTAMCGIFGAVIGTSSPLRSGRGFEKSVTRLFELSESRGKEAAGIAISNDDALSVFKAAIPATEMLRGTDYRAFMRDAMRDGKANGVAFIGHSRLVTDGAREQIVESTLLGMYNFELAEDTVSTWRIGDGTAPFYNYIYHAIAGLTENDTFRSNQIREGVMDRERALAFIERDNKPRFPSIQWYLRTIGMDGRIEEVLETIERAPKLYAHKL
jgi:hypothetical protein